MTNVLITNLSMSSGRIGSSLCGSKPIKDLITKFEKLDNLPGKSSRFTKSSIRLETQLSSNQRPQRPVSMFADISKESQRQNTNYYTKDSYFDAKDDTEIDNNPLIIAVSKNEKKIFFSNNFLSNNSFADDSKTISGTSYYNDSNSVEIPWNKLRRKSSVQLLKPSSLPINKHRKSHNDEHSPSIPSTPTTPTTHLSSLSVHNNNKSLQTNSIILPKRLSGPIYESRRSSFSAIKPSEIWDADELPRVPIRHISRCANEMGKTNTIKEDEILNDENNEPAPWVKKPADSLFLMKPSNVKSVEANQKQQNTNSIQPQLLQWCQLHTKKYKNVKITNFSSSWADGLAFCALVHSFLPSSIDYDKLVPENRRRNLEIAFKAAEKYANIIPLLEVDDMIAMGNKPDSKCIYTYVSTMYTKLNKMKSTL